MKKYPVKNAITLIMVFIASVIVGFFVTKIIHPSPDELEDTDTIRIDTTRDVRGDSIPDTTQVKTDTIPEVIEEPVKPEPIPPVNPPSKKQKPSNETLTRIINNLNNNNFPRDITIKYTNLEKDEPQGSISNIRTYLRGKTWESVTVVESEFDEKSGKIISITLRINRPTEENEETAL